MARSAYSIEKRLLMMQLALDVLESDLYIQRVLVTHSYDAQERQQGRQLYEQAVAAHQRQWTAYGAQYIATDTFHSCWSEARKAYTRLVQIARIALQDEPRLLVALGLSGARSKQFAGWFLQAVQYYDSALAQPTVQACLSHYGIDLHQLREGRVQLVAVEAAHQEQQQARGAAQEATQQRDAALEAMDRWYSRLLSVARVALDDAPQQISKLRLRV